MQVERALFWTPRILGVLFAAFLGSFALDVFGEGWRWGAAGGTLLIALGAWYLLGTWGRFHWSAYLAISGPLFLTGGLFLAHWASQARLRCGN
jgi:hypothetical protein